LNADTLSEQGREFARLFRDGNHGGAISDTDNAARFAFVLDQITGAESEMGVHNFEKRNGADCSAPMRWDVRQV
jgi:hypothetical protein